MFSWSKYLYIKVCCTVSYHTKKRSLSRTGLSAMSAGSPLRPRVYIPETLLGQDANWVNTIYFFLKNSPTARKFSSYKFCEISVKWVALVNTVNRNWRSVLNITIIYIWHLNFTNEYQILFFLLYVSFIYINLFFFISLNSFSFFAFLLLRYNLIVYVPCVSSH